jgi:hypothetical protein
VKTGYRLLAALAFVLAPVAALADDDCGDVRSTATCGIWQTLDAASGSCMMQG